ncbi:unnamed protein product [marine sediment metagenome]|uniref:YopX protein domain-containing protein n=1 Tax=marine sediment metagenome TaxID=412755 RepID=X0YHL7_9ZZZZ
MRKIKFRAWLKKDGILVDKSVMAYQIERCFHDAGHTLDGDRCEVRDFHGFSEVLQDVEDGDIILMQYTGLKDKDEKEIYEGDVVKCRDFTGIVTFDEGCFRLDLGAYEMDLALSIYCTYHKNAHEPKIIGNVYENPELLKEIK